MNKGQEPEQAGVEPKKGKKVQLDNSDSETMVIEKGNPEWKLVNM